jgi:hypothetical protein
MNLPLQSLPFACRFLAMLLRGRRAQARAAHFELASWNSHWEQVDHSA